MASKYVDIERCLWKHGTNCSLPLPGIAVSFLLKTASHLVLMLFKLPAVSCRTALIFGNQRSLFAHTGTLQAANYPPLPSSLPLITCRALTMRQEVFIGFKLRFVVFVDILVCVHVLAATQ